MEQKRVLILTDSLGCPRNETTVEHTWTDKILKWGSRENYYFYTYCQHGLFFNNIPMQYILEIQPDIIIFQVGVVDACRRTMTKRAEKIFCRIPVIRKYIHLIRKKYHFFITKHINIHYSTLKDVEMICETLIEKTRADLCFIEIAPSSIIMNNSIYNFSEDVKAYNEIFYRLKNNNIDRVSCLEPYKNINPDIIFLNDGHHLNDKGLDLVYSAVLQYLEREKEN